VSLMRTDILPGGNQGVKRGRILVAEGGGLGHLVAGDRLGMMIGAGSAVLHLDKEALEEMQIQ